MITKLTFLRLSYHFFVFTVLFCELQIIGSELTREKIEEKSDQITTAQAKEKTETNSAANSNENNQGTSWKDGFAIPDVSKFWTGSIVAAGFALVVAGGTYAIKRGYNAWSNYQAKSLEEKVETGIAAEVDATDWNNAIKAFLEAGTKKWIGFDKECADRDYLNKTDPHHLLVDYHWLRQLDDTEQKQWFHLLEGWTAHYYYSELEKTLTEEQQDLMQIERKEPHSLMKDPYVHCLSLEQDQKVQALFKKMDDYHAFQTTIKKKLLKASSSSDERIVVLEGADSGSNANFSDNDSFHSDEEK